MRAVMLQARAGYRSRRHGGLPIRLTPVWIAILAAAAAGQENRTVPPRLNLPYGPVTRLASPDGSHVLYGVPYRKGINEGPQLWIEDTRTHRRTMLLAISGTVSAVWSADSSTFAVEDDLASDSTQTYIYDVHTLKRVSLADRILAADPGAEHFTKGHAYFDLEHWDTGQQAIVRFHGHTDEAPVVCFDFHYRVSGNGVVEKLSERVSPLNGNQPCR